MTWKAYAELWRDACTSELVTHMPELPMTWHDVSPGDQKRLQELACSYSLHGLHIEDCSNGNQRAKFEDAGRYVFIILKLLVLENDHLRNADLALFLGCDFLITVHNSPVAILHSLRLGSTAMRPDHTLHRILDGVVESYLPVLDTLEDRIEDLQDQVVGWPTPTVLERIGEIRNTLMQLRRVLSATRRLAFQMRHGHSPLISRDLMPFLRDVHDDLAINLDAIAGQRDRLEGVLEVYLSSIANRTTEATRTLTLLGTVALPALVITSIFGMNIQYPSWTKSYWIFPALMAFTVALTTFLVWFLRRVDYLPGGSTSRTGTLRKPRDHPVRRGR
jgi:magnesium transporter